MDEDISTPRALAALTDAEAGPMESIPELEHTGARTAGALVEQIRMDQPKFRMELLKMIADYLRDEGLTASHMTLLNELKLRTKEEDRFMQDVQHLKQGILAGNWGMIEELTSRPFLKEEKAVLYAIFKQQFLEYVEFRELQKAFTLLNKRLKPLEHYQPTRTEFRDLCYLLSAKVVNDAPSFRNWAGVHAAREKLVDTLNAMFESRQVEQEDSSGLLDEPVPPGRLVQLLQQALAYQVTSVPFASESFTSVKTLTRDYEPNVLPHRLWGRLRGHQANVKALRFFGRDHLVSASSDSSLIVWDLKDHARRLSEGDDVTAPSGDAASSSSSIETIFPATHLTGHQGRVWDVDVHGGDLSCLIASAGADRSVKLWRWSPMGDESALGIAADIPGPAHGYGPGPELTPRMLPRGAAAPSPPVTHAHTAVTQIHPYTSQNILAPTATLAQHAGDIFAVRLDPKGRSVANAGYDRTIRLHDIERRALLKTFSGHSANVTSLRFNGVGNLIVSGSKDGTVRFWDALGSGLCVRTLSAQLASEVSSIDVKDYFVLTSSRDNMIRLWDMRNMALLKRFKQHANTSHNLIRTSFSLPSSVVSGSEDSMLYVWDIDSANVVQRLPSDAGVVYGGEWNRYAALLAQYSDSTAIDLWAVR